MGQTDACVQGAVNFTVEKRPWLPDCGGNWPRGSLVMPDPLTDAQLADYAALAERLTKVRAAIPGNAYTGRFPSDLETEALLGKPWEVIHALLAEVARLRGELTSPTSMSFARATGFVKIFYAAIELGMDTIDQPADFKATEMIVEFMRGLKEQAEPGPRDDSDTTPPIGETCKACGQAITRERGAVQMRKAGFEAFWVCSWLCAVELAHRESRDA